MSGKQKKISAGLSVDNMMQQGVEEKGGEQDGKEESKEKIE